MRDKPQRVLIRRKRKEPKAALGYGQHYIDEYGQVWKRINDYHIWKSDTGYGTWDNGKGMKLL